MKRKTKNILYGLVITSVVTSVTPIKPFAQEIYTNSNIKEEAQIAIENRSKDVFTIDNKLIEKKESKASELVGNDRFDTAIKVSQAGWNASKNVVLVNANSLADALSVTPFASQEDAPVLLSDANSLNPNTKKEISRLGANKVYIIGGISVISENIVNELKSMGITVERISGEDRYQTSLAVAKKLNNVSEIAVVNGEKGFADAVSIAPVCARDKMAIVYASPQNGLNVFNDFIKTNGIKTSYIVGGTAVLPEQIVSTLKNPIRIAGNDRNSTNLDIIKKFYSNANNKIELNNLFIAKNGYKSDSDLIDALSVGVLAGKQNSPIMLVSPTGLDSNQSKALSSMTVKQLTQIGGNGNENAFTELKDKIENSSTPSEPSAPSTPSTPSAPSVPSTPSAPSNPTTQVEADKVIAMIDALNSNITLDDYATVVEAREAYDNLSKEAQALVSNLKKLTDAEAELDRLGDIEIEKYNEIIDLIDELETVTVDNVKEERVKFDNIVSLISQLHPSEAQNLPSRTLEEKKAEIEAVEAMVANAKKVSDMIQELDRTLVIDDKDEVVNARAAYEALTQEEKALVTNENILVEAEAKISALEQIDADKQIVASLITRIDALKGETINIEDHETEIKNIMAEYDKLEKIRQDEVTNYQDLLDADLQLSNIYADIIHLEYLINQLPDVIENAHGAKVEQAKKEFEALTSKNQCGVKEDLVEKLNDAIRRAEALKQIILQNNVEVKYVVVEIEQLPSIEDIGVDDKVEVYGLVRRYVELPEDVKFAVDTTTLEESFDKIETIMAEEVVDLIDKLPSIDDLELSHSSLLKEVRAKYDEISSRNNTKVTNINKLTELEAKMLELENVNPVIIEIVNKIKDLDHTITFDNYDETITKVTEIEALIDTITDDEFDLITNLTKYEEVLTQLDVLSRVSHITTGAEVVELINKLPEAEKITWGHGDDLTDIKNAYTKISDSEKQLIDSASLTKLQEAMAEYNRIDNGINEVLSAIHRIPAIEDLTLADEHLVVEAKNLYDKHDEKVTYYVNFMNGGHLEDAINKIEELKKA